MANHTYKKYDDIGSLLQSISRQTVKEAREITFASNAQALPEIGYVPTVGYHVYGELKLTNKFLSPEDNVSAAVCLNAIVATTKIADRCVREEGGQLVEAQGKILHAFLHSTGNSPDDLKSLVRFARALTQTVYKVVKPLCGDGWNGFTMAADSGEALILTTATRSTISLGACANRPAKKLAQGVPSGTIAVRAETGRWEEINLLDQSADTKEDRTKFARYESLASGITAALPSLTVNFARNFDKQASTWIEEKNATALHGHVLRADLDGFSSCVEEAFRAADQETAIMRLALDFNNLVQRAEVTFHRFSPNGKLLLPWAGDCLNGIIFPAHGETFSDSQGTLPVTFGAHWHGEFQRQNTDKWTIGIAGGDADVFTTTSNGRVIIATIGTDSRDFTVAVGWGCGMSLRAQEANGAKANDTVIPVEDYRQLEPIYQDFFSSLPDARYYHAPLLTPDKLRDTATERGRATISTNSAIPLTRPWLDPSNHA